MSETWLSVDGSPSVKVVLKQIGRSEVGNARRDRDVSWETPRN
jgi:hypothetical protein